MSVTRGRWPGATTLNGLSAAFSTKLCMRWLMPIPLRPAITAGTQAPLGVTDTTQPSASAASIDVVPRKKPESVAAPAWLTSWPARSGLFGLGAPSVRHLSRIAFQGFSPPSGAGHYSASSRNP